MTLILPSRGVRSQDGKNRIHPHGTVGWHAPLPEGRPGRQPRVALDAFLPGHPVQPAYHMLQDNIIGKAAALRIHWPGCRTVQAGIERRWGAAVLPRDGMASVYAQLVERHR